MPEQDQLTGRQQPAYIAQSGETWAITYPVQANQDPVTGHTASLGQFFSDHRAPAYIAVRETGFMLVPEVLFREDKLDVYGRYFGAKPDERIASQNWPAAKCRYVYGCREVPDDKSAGVFPAALVIHEALQAIYPDKADVNFAILSAGEVSLFFYAQKQLIFFNRFGFENYDELAYFTVEGLSQCGASLKKISLLAEGYDAGRAHEHLKRFVETEHISTGRLPDLPGFSLMEELSLYGLQLCASSAGV